MAERITDEMIEAVATLAQLSLADVQALGIRNDMEKMLDYADRLNEADTSEIEPMTACIPQRNVFREDVITNGDGSKAALANAPARQDDGFLVPRTIA